MATAIPRKRLLPLFVLMLTVPTLGGCAAMLAQGAVSALAIGTNLVAGSALTNGIFFSGQDKEEAAARQRDYDAGLTPAEADRRAKARAAARKAASGS